MENKIDLSKLITIAENQEKVYDAGYTAGAASGTPMIAGTATSDANTIVTFPELDFTPQLITIWNVAKEAQDDTVPYLYTGFMLMAKYIDGEWISQGMDYASGATYLANASATGGTGASYPNAPSSCVSVTNNIYSYQLSRVGPFGEEFGNFMAQDFADITVNYAIYG